MIVDRMTRKATVKRLSLGEAATQAGLEITDVIFLMKYPVKTAVTIAVLVEFWWKRYVVLGISARLSSPSKSSARVARSVVAFFAFQLIIQVGTRIAEMLDRKNVAPVKFPWFEITNAQQQYFLMASRCLTEGIRVLCSGYLSVLLVDVGRSFQATVSQVKAAMTSSGTPLNSLSMLSIAREHDIALAELVQGELSWLLIICFLSEILSLICVVGELFSTENVTARIRLGGSTAMYLFSMFVLCRGLIGLSDQDDALEIAVKKFQSASTLNILHSGPDCAYFKRKHGDGSVVPGSQANSSGGLTDAQVKTLRLFTTTITNGFRKRSATVALGEFGHISRATILTVFGLLLTFCCFVLEQTNDHLMGQNSLNATIAAFNATTASDVASSVCNYSKASS
ncbi:hypothetical protein BV898_03437 [Hypsibius exemplaris]|uniref:Gustatory receptor n=1 Tax=Hypsibius exemplaris TaxID=2072580 RepID=A0A1W0X5L5_HYPEX|nr:hypothetical protein BV898_03437 [Hypsibius exemplaris]